MIHGVIQRPDVCVKAVDDGDEVKRYQIKNTQRSPFWLLLLLLTARTWLFGASVISTKKQPYYPNKIMSFQLPVRKKKSSTSSCSSELLKGMTRLEFQTKGHCQIVWEQKASPVGRMCSHTLNVLNGLCEAFLAFFFPVRADAVPPVPHKSVSVQGLWEKLGFARLQASMNVGI